MRTSAPLLVVSRCNQVSAVLCSTLETLGWPGPVEPMASADEAVGCGNLAKYSAIVVYCSGDDRPDTPRSLLSAGFSGPLVCLDARPDVEYPAPVQRLALPVSLNALGRCLSAPPAAENEETTLHLAGGRFLFNTKSCVISRVTGEAGPPLTEKETALLLFLYNSASHCAQRDDLLSAVWGYRNGVETHTLETYIYRLRQKFPVQRGETAPLYTRSGGYQLDA